LSEEAKAHSKCREYLDVPKWLENDKAIYGINTGFGSGT
jgi:histidine ammonia-lyase